MMVRKEPCKHTTRKERKDKTYHYKGGKVVVWECAQCKALGASLGYGGDIVEGEPTPTELTLNG